MKTDSRLQRDILDELLWEPSVDAAEIGVTVDDGIVTLTGRVPSYPDKLTAERAAQRILGVKAVANDLTVSPRDLPDHSDSDIAKAAVSALEWHVSIPAERVKLSVSKGWISLEGTVDWYYQRVAAEDAVRHLTGVRGVLNHIEVEPSAPASEVKSRIEDAFRRNAEVDAANVQVEASEGKVTLLGDVRSWAERQEAERTAWAAPGVVSVVNRLGVRPYETAYAT